MDTTTAADRLIDWNPILDTIRHGPVPEEGPRAIPASGVACVERLRRLGFELSEVLDIGSGNGRLLIGMREHGVEFGRYTGVDCIRECADWCQEHLRPLFPPWRSVRFFHWNVRNAFYNPDSDTGLLNTRDWEPIEKTYANVILSSVLTHVGTVRDAETLLEIAIERCRPGGRIFTTWFTSPPNAPHSGCDRTVFTWRQILEIIARQAVLTPEQPVRVVHLEEGETPAYHDQLVIVLEKPS